MSCEVISDFGLPCKLQDNSQIEEKVLNERTCSDQNSSQSPVNVHSDPAKEINSDSELAIEETKEIKQAPSESKKQFENSVFFSTKSDISQETYSDEEKTLHPPLKKYANSAEHDYGGWAPSDINKVYLRTPKYLKTRSQSDKKKQDVPLIMQPIGFEIFEGSSSSPDHLAINPACSFYKDIRAKHPNRYFVLINLMCTGVKTSVLSVFAVDKEVMDKQPKSWRNLWKRFVEADDKFRNECFKLFVFIREGPWMLRQISPSVPTLLGQKVPIKYICGENYLEFDVMADQSTLAWGAIKIAYPACKSIVVDLSYILQSENEEDLPEVAFAGIQLKKIDLKKGIRVKN